MLSYVLLKELVFKAGLKNRDDYRVFRKESTLKELLPSDPNKFYADKWESWHSFFSNSESKNKYRSFLELELGGNKIYEYATKSNSNPNKAKPDWVVYGISPAEAANHIVDAAKSKKISIRQLLRKRNLPCTCFYEIKRGERTPTILTAQKIDKCLKDLGINLGEIDTPHR